MADKPASNQDNGIGWLLLIALLATAAYGLWMLFREPVLEAMTLWRRLLLEVLALVVNDPDVTRMIRSLRSGAPSEAEVMGASTLFGAYYRWPVGAILAVLGLLVLFHAPRTRFRTRYGLETLMAAQARAWPYIQPVLAFNPLAANSRVPGKPVPEQLPPFAEALAPEEWVAYHAIALGPDGTPDANAARRAFALQLCGRWRGAEALPVPLKALFAAFALKAARKRQQSDDLLAELARCWTVEKGFRASPALNRALREALRDKGAWPEAEEVARGHAYTSTAFLRVLLWARERGGVLAPAQFLWLRGHDRALWYPLNNLGRGTFHIEAAGALAHFRHERRIGRPVLAPKFDPAVDALAAHFRQGGITVPPRERREGSRTVVKAAP